MFKDFLASVPKNFIRSFSGKNLFWHLTAIALTVAIVMSGFDWYYFLSVRGESLNIIFFPGIIVGGLLPILLPLGLVIVGRRSRNGVTKVYGWALMQAALAVQSQSDHRRR
jgi:hypothetical protein